MELKRLLHMNEGEGERSYAKNSSLQERGALKAWSIVEGTILDLYCTTFPASFGIADLGCSSGPNSLLIVTKIIDAVNRRCHSMGHSMPEFRVFLNDLPSNDFNSVFRRLPNFYEKRREQGEEFESCFIAGVPCSFFGRAFPSTCLHFVHSSYALHWLSQVPLGLQSKEGMPLNKGHIYISDESPPGVWEAYLEQFQKDFSLFLKSRAEEIVNGGRMVLTLLGRSSPNRWTKEGGCTFGMLEETLTDLVSKGLIQEEKIHSFNLPLYKPSVVELEAEIEREGSFAVNQAEIFKLKLDASDDSCDYNEFSGERAAKIIRAGMEPMLANHFGEEIMDDMFKRYGEVIGEHLAKQKIMYTSIVISMKKKEG